MDMSEEQAVRYAQTAGIATITLNRPGSLNAMNDALMAGIGNAVAQVDADPSVRVLILTGSGRGFCAGADLAGVAAGTQDQAGDAGGTAAGADLFNNAIRALQDCPVPTIARINGPAAGGGFGLAMACDISIAAESAFFVATFGPRLGIVPDMGVTWHLPLRAGRARALGISLLGERISSAQAQQWGLIWKAVPDDELDAEVVRTAEVLKRSSPGTSTRIRACIDAAVHNSLSAQLDLEMQHQAVLIPRNMHEGAAAFMQKREPEFSGRRD